MNVKIKEKKIINMTPHPITLFLGEEKIEIPSSGIIRLSEHSELNEEVFVGNATVPIYRKRFGSAELPPVREDTYYIVSLPVALAFPERCDFLITNDIVRDERGRVIGCRSFARICRGEQQ